MADHGTILTKWICINANKEGNKLGCSSDVRVFKEDGSPTWYGKLHRDFYLEIEEE